MQLGERKLTGGAAIVEAARANGMTTSSACRARRSTRCSTRSTARTSSSSCRVMSKPPPTWRWATRSRRAGPACSRSCPGPGVLNAAAALCTAMGNCAPRRLPHRPGALVVPRPWARPSARARGSARARSHAHQGRLRIDAAGDAPLVNRGVSHAAAAARARSRSRCAGTRWPPKRMPHRAGARSATARSPTRMRSTPPCVCSARRRSR